MLVALLALATATAPLLSTAHLIAVRHATCDHGEFIEISEAGGEAHRHEAPCIRQSPAASEHGHDHCSIAAPRHARAVAQERAPFVGDLAAPLARAPSDRVPQRQIQILQVAPKNSPPA